MIQSFIAGFFIFNALPHLVKGITGQTHMTPFKRVSSPSLNIVWAFFNIFSGLVILNWGKGTNQTTIVPGGDELLWFLIGGFTLGLMAAWLFGRKNARFPWHRD